MIVVIVTISLSAAEMPSLYYEAMAKMKNTDARRFGEWHFKDNKSSQL